MLIPYLSIPDNMLLKEALFYTPEEGGLRCQLCPHLCLVTEGQAGTCRIRKNIDGTLIASSYGRISSMHMDPMEKKPLYHFFPGRIIHSVGTAGCNLRCRYCQNCGISQSSIDDLPLISKHSPGEVVSIALEDKENIGIAYTYNEPTVWIEFLLDIAEKASVSGLKNVMVTNGYINPEPLGRVLEYVDAFNVDLKGFTEDFYRKIAFATLEPVKTSLSRIRDAGKHLEITTLVVPGLNDDRNDFRSMIDWICGELGEKTPLHLSRYFPMHRMNLPPTPMSTLLALHAIASERMPYVYLGNVGYQDAGMNTHCASCGQKVIERIGYSVNIDGLDAMGHCRQCGESIAVLR